MVDARVRGSLPSMHLSLLRLSKRCRHMCEEIASALRDVLPWLLTRFASPADLAREVSVVEVRIVLVAHACLLGLATIPNSPR